MIRVDAHVPDDGIETQEILAASGISVRLWRLYAYFWFVCLLFPVLFLIQSPPAGVHPALAVAGLLVFVLAYFGVMWAHPLEAEARLPLNRRAALGLIAGLTILVLLLGYFVGSPFLWLLVGVSAIAGRTLSFLAGSAFVFGLTLMTLGAGLVLGPEVVPAGWLRVLPLVLLVRGLGLDMIGFLRLADALRELQAARAELARRAVSEERLRVARDLHDLLGQALSLITLKSELAGRLLDHDPEAARREVREVERVARQTLRDVREAVAGYRRPTLQGELDGARQVLEAAGIACVLDVDAPRLPPEAEELLAWAVREGVTNVIRHSRAQRCSIRVSSGDGRAAVEILNDGAPRPDPSGAPPGTGLAGLRERAGQAGGALQAGPLPTDQGSGFRLRAEIPLEGRPPRRSA